MPTHYCVKTLEALLPCPSHIQEGPLQAPPTPGSLMAAHMWRGYTESGLCYSVLNPSH
jgi:hypothetical protein